MLIVRSDLIRQIDSISDRLGRISLPAMCDALDAIRHDARRYGLEPLERLASTFESALSVGRLGPLAATYLELMRDAVGCEDVSESAANAYLAALSMRQGY
jgi:hypothetical protein